MTTDRLLSGIARAFMWGAVASVGFLAYFGAAEPRWTLWVVLAVMGAAFKRGSRP